MHFLQAINSDISVLIVCNKTGGTIKGDIKKNRKILSHVSLDVIGGSIRRLFSEYRVWPEVVIETSGLLKRM